MHFAFFTQLFHGHLHFPYQVLMFTPYEFMEHVARNIMHSALDITMAWHTRAIILSKQLSQMLIRLSTVPQRLEVKPTIYLSLL